MAVEWRASGAQPSTKSARGPQMTGPLDVSFTPALPASYGEFAALAGGRPPADLALVVSRIRGANTAALAADSRRGLQVLYGYLVQHFVELAKQRPPAMAHLDALTPLLVGMTAEVPFYAATLARARLSRAQQRLAAALKQPGEEGDYGWPSNGVLLQLQLYAMLFPLSDKQHPVATPAALLTGAYLATCPVVAPRHAAVGLLLAGMALKAAAAGGRFAPEPLNFAVDLIADAARGGEDAVLQTRHSAAAGSAEPPPPLQLDRILGAEPGAAFFSTKDIGSSVLAAALQLIARAAQLADGSPALPEMLQPAAAALEALGSSSHLPPHVEASRQATLQDIQARRAAAVASRVPLVRKSDKAAAVKLYNPRFEDDFVAGKDFDPDRERAAHKRLQRQVQKEKRGAMRELRKDAVFIDTERSAEKAAAKAERRATNRAGFALLEKQEADMKSGGQGGMWKKRKTR